MVKKLNISFKNENLIELLKITKDGKFKIPMDAIEEALEILRSLQNMAKKGYSEIIIRNPYSGEEIITSNKHLTKLSIAYINSLNSKSEYGSAKKCSKDK